MLLIAVALMAVGVIVPLLSRPSPSAHGVAALSGSVSPADAGPGGVVWSPAAFKVGFSFVVGFVIAYALRWFLRTALLAAGFMALLLFGLQYAGLVEVKWGAMGERYEAGSGWVSRQTASFAAFVGGALPSAGAAGLGMFAGMRRRV